MHAGVHERAYGRHRLGLGEDLRVRSNADLEILAPGVLLDQHLFQMRGFRRAWLQLRQIIAHEAGDLGADRGGGGQVAPRAFLDHAFQHGNREGDTRRLDRLQVDWRQQPWLAFITRFGRRVGQQRRHGANRVTLGFARQARGIGALAQIAHGRARGGDIEYGTITDRDHGWADIGPPDPPHQRGDRGVFRQSGARRFFDVHCHETFLNFRSDRKFSGIGSFGNSCGHCVHDTSPP